MMEVSMVPYWSSDKTLQNLAFKHDQLSLFHQSACLNAAISPRCHSNQSSLLSKLLLFCSLKSLPSVLTLHQKAVPQATAVINRGQSDLLPSRCCCPLGLHSCPLHQNCILSFKLDAWQASTRLLVQIMIPI